MSKEKEAPFYLPVLKLLERHKTEERAMYLVWVCVRSITKESKL